MAKTFQTPKPRQKEALHLPVKLRMDPWKDSQSCCQGFQGETSILLMNRSQGPEFPLCTSTQWSYLSFCSGLCWAAFSPSPKCPWMWLIPAESNEAFTFFAFFCHRKLCIIPFSWYQMIPCHKWDTAVSHRNTYRPSNRMFKSSTQRQLDWPKANDKKNMSFDCLFLWHYLNHSQHPQAHSFSIGYLLLKLCSETII